MNAPLADSLAFFHAVQRGVRAQAGKALPEALRRWRHTRSGEHAHLELKAGAARFLIRYGLLDAGDEEPARQAAYQALLKAGARASGESPGVLGAWLLAFAAGEDGWPDGPLCGAVPQCVRCPLCETCRYLAAGARAERLSSAALAQTLSGPQEAGARDGPAIASRSPATPAAAELLAFLLFPAPKGAGAVARAEALLKAHGGLRGLLRAAVEPVPPPGLKPDLRARLRALGELVRHWSAEEAPHGHAFLGGQDFYDHYRLRLRDLKKECFCVACLDQKNRLLGEEQVSIGSLTEALVHPREVLRPAIVLRAAAIAIVHNHPSGDPEPSRSDKALTRRLQEAAGLVGVRLLDHVIVGDKKFFSFAEEGLL